MMQDFLEAVAPEWTLKLGAGQRGLNCGWAVVSRKGLSRAIAPEPL